MTSTTTTVEVDEQVVLEALACFDAIEKLSILANGGTETPMTQFASEAFTAFYADVFGPVQTDDYGDDPIVKKASEQGAVLVARFLEELGLRQMGSETR